MGEIFGGESGGKGNVPKAGGTSQDQPDRGGIAERVLIAEDESALRINICEFLTRSGHEVATAEDGHIALQRVLEEDFGVVIADIRMPRMDGVTLLKHIMAERPDTLVLLMTAYASVDTAIEALRLGAHDYILKPLELEDLGQKVRNLAAYHALKREVVRLRRTLSRQRGFEGIVGDSPAIRRIFELIDKVARTRSTVLVTGESGTGKELVARAIQARSDLADREFLSVNVAAIPDTMLESQLFGHEKGAFTGADRQREGLLRSSRGGTVFLDEIGELPLSAQTKLLRAIEAGEVLPLGATRPHTAVFRLIAATNQDLESAVQAGTFRRDLFYRINVFRIEIPPLRERREDIPALVAHYLEHHARAVGLKPRGVSNDAMRLLLGYHWPGNVRELSNVVERAVIMAGADDIGPQDLPADLANADAAPVNLRAALERFERRHLSWVLRASGGSRERAAEMLGVDRATLYRRLAKYGQI